jgi:hypothetical protein
MKVWCKVRGNPAVVVGYAPGAKGRVMAVVITKGKLEAVRLKDVKLDDISLWPKGADKRKVSDEIT